MLAILKFLKVTSDYNFKSSAVVGFLGKKMVYMTGQLLCMFQKLSIGWTSCSETLMQTRNYAARRSTRERKAKILKALKTKKKAREAQQAKIVGFHPTLRYMKKKTVTPELPDYLKYKEYLRPEPTDNVFIAVHYQWKKYHFAEAVQSHRKDLHPTIFNVPNSMLKVFVELNMQGVKKSKPVSKFTRMVSTPYPFEHGEERSIAAFCKTEEDLAEAKEAGATGVFGPSDIKEIAKGEISLSNFSVFVAHPNIMPDLMTIKGLMRKMYPTLKAGTLSPNLKSIINTQLHGVKYTAIPYENHKEYGSAEIPIGMLQMDIEHLEENFKAALNDINEARPKREGPFILRTCLICPPNSEKFKIDHLAYIMQKPADDGSVEDEEDEENLAIISPA